MSEEESAKLIITPYKKEIKEEDWRGILALTFTFGTIMIGLLELVVAGSTVLFEKILPLDAMIVAYYFGAKSK